MDGKRGNLYGYQGYAEVVRPLCRMIPDAVIMNCDLPSVSRQLEDPEYFFSNLPSGTTVIFDEIHRLNDPSKILKIGTDEFRISGYWQPVLLHLKQRRNSVIH